MLQKIRGESGISGMGKSNKTRDWEFPRGHKN
jgi:hypothetical protein